MTDASSAPQLEEAQTATALGRGSRWLCALVGLLAGGAGSVAVYVTPNDIGSGVLLAVGTIFLVMATTGHPITSAKLGNNEIQLARRIGRGFQQVIEEAPPELQQDLAETVLRAPLPDQDPLREYAKGVAGTHEALHYEQLVRSALTRIGFVPLASPSQAPDLRTDVVGTYDGSAVVVEVKWSHAATSDRLVRMAINQVQQYAQRFDSTSLVGALVVTNQKPQKRYTGEWFRQSHPEVLLVTWVSPEDDGHLRAALDELTSGRG